MKRIVPIIVSGLLSLVMLLVLTACSININVKDRDTEAPAETQTEVPAIEVPEEEIPTEVVPEEVRLVSDDTHFVMEMSGVILSYEYEDDEIIGCKGYVNAGSEETAKTVAQQYDVAADETIAFVETRGIYVVITFTEKAYAGLTLSALEEVFGEEQISE